MPLYYTRDSLLCFSHIFWPHILFILCLPDLISEILDSSLLLSQKHQNSIWTGVITSKLYLPALFFLYTSTICCWYLSVSLNLAHISLVSSFAMYVWYVGVHAGHIWTFAFKYLRQLTNSVSSFWINPIPLLYSWLQVMVSGDRPITKPFEAPASPLTPPSNQTPSLSILLAK